MLTIQKTHRKIPMKLIVTTHVPAPLTKVWKAYTSPEDIVNWNTASADWHTTLANVDLRAGGRFLSRMEAKDGSSGFDFAGEYINVEPEKLIDYRFGEREASVRFANEPGGVRVTISFDPETTNPVDKQLEGWQAILDNFARYVDSLPDQ
jgi:uncharacterized protein YndB with AHSA1/START domain